MEVIKLTRDNVSDFEELIPEDIAENIGRTKKEDTTWMKP